MQLDQQVPEIGTLRRAAARQVVARRCGAGRPRHALHLGLFAQPALHRLQVPLRRADVIALGQQHVGPEVGFVERREEVLRQAFHDEEREHKEPRYAEQGHPTVAQQRRQQAVEGAVEARIVRVARGRGDAQHGVAEQRSLRQGQHPAQQQRKRQHDKQRLDDLGHGRRRQIQRQEREDGDQRGAQKAPARCRGPLDEGLPARSAAQHRLTGVVRNDDGVVDEHPHGDDEPGKRRAVQPFAQELHQEQRPADREEQRAPDQHPRAEAHHQHDDRNDDRHRLRKVQQEGPRRFTGNAVLGVEHRKLQPHGHSGRQRREQGVDPLPGLHHVDARLGRDADSRGPASVDPHQRPGRLRIAAFDPRQVAQAVLLAHGGDQQLVFQIVEAPVGALFENPHLQLPGPLLAAVDDGVLLADRRHDRLRADRKVRQRRKAHVDIHHGGLLAVEGHLLHPVDGHQRTLQALRPVAQLRLREALVGRQPVVDAVDVAEVVRHGDGRSPRRELRLDVQRLAPQFVPQLGDLPRTGSRIQFDLDLREPVPRLRGDLVHAAHRLHLAFDRFGDELLDLLRRSARVGAEQHRTLDDKGRILLLAQGREARHAPGQQQKEEKADHTAVAQRIFRKVHGRIS